MAAADDSGNTSASRVVPYYPPREVVDHVTDSLMQREEGRLFLRQAVVMEVSATARLAAMPLKEIPDEEVIDLTVLVATTSSPRRSRLAGISSMTGRSRRVRRTTSRR